MTFSYRSRYFQAQKESFTKLLTSKLASLKIHLSLTACGCSYPTTGVLEKLFLVQQKWRKAQTSCLPSQTQRQLPSHRLSGLEETLLGVLGTILILGTALQHSLHGVSLCLFPLGHFSQSVINLFCLHIISLPLECKLREGGHPTGAQLAGQRTNTSSKDNHVTF